MKHIKTYEEKQEISQEEKDLNNLARRIERNINKYFNIPDKVDFRYIYIRTNFNNKYNTGVDYDISFYMSPFLMQNSDKEKFQKVQQYFRDNRTRKASQFEYILSKDEATDFLKELKLNFIYKDVEKYNL